MNMRLPLQNDRTQGTQYPPLGPGLHNGSNNYVPLVLGFINIDTNGHPPPTKTRTPVHSHPGCVRGHFLTSINWG